MSRPLKIGRTLDTATVQRRKADYFELLIFSEREDKRQASGPDCWNVRFFQSFFPRCLCAIIGRDGDVSRVRRMRSQLPQGTTGPPHSFLQAIQHALHVLREGRGFLSVLQQKGVEQGGAVTLSLTALYRHACLNLSPSKLLPEPECSPKRGLCGEDNDNFDAFNSL